MKQFILNLISSGSGTSSKRVISIFIVLVLSISLFIIEQKPDVISALEFIAITALGTSAVEKFRNTK